MNKIHHKDELATDLRDSLARMLDSEPTTEELDRAMTGLCSVRLSSLPIELPQESMSNPRPLFNYWVGQALAGCLVVALFVVASTEAWADVTRNYSSPLNEPQPVSTLAESAKDQNVENLPVGFAVRILLLAHVFSLLFGLLAMALSWMMGLGTCVIAQWRPTSQAQSHRNFQKRLLLVGILFYGTGILLGTVWSQVTWGYAWNWDPKEVLCLLSLAISFLWLGIATEKTTVRPSVRAENERYATLATIAFGTIFLMVPIGSHLTALQNQHSSLTTLPTILTGLSFFFILCAAFIWLSFWLSQSTIRRSTRTQNRGLT